LNFAKLKTQQPPALTLVSHLLCPYVQRAAIVLAEKGAIFDRRDIDLAKKPDWFLKVSPLGKTPVLLVADQAIFESAVICEFLEDVLAPALHPKDPLERAQHRAWMEFGSNILNNIAALYSASDDAALNVQALSLKAKFSQIEPAVASHGPYFAGPDFSLVDAVFGPIFRYFDVFDSLADFDTFTDLPRVRAWRTALAIRPSVKGAVRSDYPELLRAFLLKRDSALGKRLSA
jgi:glutathione S-transferase